jgi:glycosyltransferase involved in cell wall biosynthesis
VAGAYEATSPDLVRDIPPATRVERAFARDAARQLSLRGRYPGVLARPDRWITWWPAAVLRGRKLLKEERASAIFSTYPIATAHVIGHTLARHSGLPWIADFRDPMAQDDYPRDARTWASFKRIEEKVFRRAAACVFTSPSAASMYRARYPNSPARVEVVENGYDEESFAEIPAGGDPLNDGKVTLLHSGIVYPEERDPRHLFAALQEVRARDAAGGRLVVRFRAAVHDAMLRDLARRHGVEDMVQIMPHVPYAEALQEMVRADALLVLQAANCNAQVPAKLYEYMRARRPMLALTDPAGDTAAVLRASGISTITPLDHSDGIANLISGFLTGVESRGATEASVAAASRRARAGQLARLLDHATGTSAP